MPGGHDKHRLIQWIRAEVLRTTGRRYRIDLESLDIQSLRELQRLLRDLEAEKDMAVRRSRIFPWKSP